MIQKLVYLMKIVGKLIDEVLLMAAGFIFPICFNRAKALQDDRYSIIGSLIIIAIIINIFFIIYFSEKQKKKTKKVVKY